MRQFMRSAIRGVARAGWVNFLFLAVLILTMPANAQTGAAISGQAITPGGTPASNAQIRICPYTATGTPCSPLASIYSDPGLTVPITQPYSADQYGNYTFWVAPNETYIIQVQVNQTIYYSYYQTIGQGGVTAGVNSAQGTYPIQVNGESSIPATGNITISCATGQCGASSLGNLITAPSSGQYIILPPTGFTPINSTASCPSTPQGYVIPDATGTNTSMFAQAGPCGNNVNPDTWGGTFSWAGALESVGLTQSRVTAVYSAEIISSSAFSGGGIPNQNQLDSACQSDTYFYTLTSGQVLEADTGFVNFVAQQGTTGNMGTGTGVDSLTCTSKATHQVANDGGAITMTVSSPVMIVYYSGTPVPSTSPAFNFAAPLYWNSALNVIGLQIPFNYGLDSGSANSYQVSIPTLLVPGQTQYIPAVGTQIVITPANTNTAASTLTINGYGAVAITKASAGSQVALSGGEIVAGVDAILVFNGTSWQLINSQTGSGISYPSGTGIAQVTSGDNWGTTLTPSTLGGFLSGQTGCSTTAYAWVPADERCEALGSGSVGGSGTTGYVPLWTASTTLGNSHLNDGITTANTITSTEPFAVNAPSQPSQVAITYDSNAVVPGSSTTVVFGANSSGQGVMSEAGGTAARICDASNGVCGSGGISFPQTVSGTTTSGGIPYFSSTTALSSSALLPSGDFVLGGGAGSAPTASFSVVPTANGGTGENWGSTGGIPQLISGTFSLYNTNCNTSGSSALTWTAGTGFGCNSISGGGGSPGGSNTDVQYNNSSSFGGSSSFTFNSSTGQVTASSFVANGSTNGFLTLTADGTAAPSAPTSSIEVAAPNSVTAYTIELPGTAPTNAAPYLNCAGSGSPYACTWSSSTGTSGALTMSTTTVSTTTNFNLTTLGTCDWFWAGNTTNVPAGHTMSAGGYNGKISNCTGRQLENSFQWFAAGQSTVAFYGSTSNAEMTFTSSASDDASAAALSAATSYVGIYVESLSATGWGFYLSAPATTTSHTLYVYMGVNDGAATCTATLSDGSASAASQTITNNSNTLLQNYLTITYNAASTGQLVYLTCAISTNDGSGSNYPAVTFNGVAFQ